MSNVFLAPITTTATEPILTELSLAIQHFVRDSFSGTEFYKISDKLYAGMMLKTSMRNIDTRRSSLLHKERLIIDRMGLITFGEKGKIYHDY